MDGNASSLISTRWTRAAADRNVCRGPDHDLTLIIPAFNEAQRLPHTLAAVKDALTTWRIDFRVIVVDDGSVDGTAELPAQYGSHFRALRLRRHRGKGAAVRAGMLQATGAVAAFTDADLPFDLDALRHAYELIRKELADVVCGARDLAGSGTKVSRSLWRHCASWTFRGAVRRLLALKVTDTQCGLKAFSRRAVESIFPRQQVEGLAFDVEVLYLAEQLGLGCVRIPVLQLTEHATTISLRRQALPMLMELVQIRWRDLSGGYDLGNVSLERPVSLPSLSDAQPSLVKFDRDAA
jgi:dolichyl-phosphate beta-glucosyltransferase